MELVTSGQKLKRFLAKNDATLATGVSRNRIRQFQDDHCVLLPDDFKSYLLEVNGTCDDYVVGIVRFWSIDEVKTVAREVANTPLDASVIQPLYRHGFVGDDSYYVFADLQHELQLYAIRLSKSLEVPNDVVLLNGDPPFVIASSFARFVDLYVASSPVLRMVWD
ncbi:MAG: SMI1/KNR4 family protein [Planctomycetales bacterium]|nr:SMI1/KNR4 family protein [Planctomycetales bacterium]